jgi:hypothetical protein
VSVCVYIYVYTYTDPPTHHKTTKTQPPPRPRQQQRSPQQEGRGGISRKWCTWRSTRASSIRFWARHVIVIVVLVWGRVLCFIPQTTSVRVCTHPPTKTTTNHLPTEMLMRACRQQLTKPTNPTKPPNQHTYNRSSNSRPRRGKRSTSPPSSPSSPRWAPQTATMPRR